MLLYYIKDRAYTPAQYLAAGYEITPLPVEFAAEVERLRAIKAKLETLSHDERAHIAELAARAALPRKQRRALEAAERRARRKQQSKTSNMRVLCNPEGGSNTWLDGDNLEGYNL